MVDWQAAGYLAGWRLVRLVPEPAVRAACRIAARAVSRGCLLYTSPSPRD